MPTRIDHAVAARSAARLVALVAGLQSGDEAMLAAASGDELHEPYRAPLSPETETLMDAARTAGALHVARSGSGPAALALVTPATADAVCDAMTRVVGADGGWARLLDIDTDGVV